MCYFGDSLVRSALRTAGILPALLFALRFRLAWCADAHDVYFENRPLSALRAQSLSPNLDQGFGPFCALHFRAAWCARANTWSVPRIAQQKGRGIFPGLLHS